jgi:hypothetical protein
MLNLFGADLKEPTLINPYKDVLYNNLKNYGKDEILGLSPIDTMIMLVVLAENFTAQGNC